MNILTFDIEDWFHLLDNDATRSERQWSAYESRIRPNTDRILDLLARSGQRATFFCLGWVGRKYPGIIRQIDSLGHEIGSHSDTHQLAYEQNAQSWRRDIQRSIEVLQELTGKKVRSFRVPGFSVTPDNPWVFETLVSCGIEIDSSVFPARRAHGGFPPGTLARPAWIFSGGVRLKEFPINVFDALGKPVVFSGGGYFRLTPWTAIRYMMRRSSYVMTYFHPRDFDPGQPMLPGLAPMRKFKSYVGLKTAFDKLRVMLDEFAFCDIATALDTIDWAHAPRLVIEPGSRPVRGRDGRAVKPSYVQNVMRFARSGVRRR